MFLYRSERGREEFDMNVEGWNIVFVLKEFRVKRYR